MSYTGDVTATAAWDALKEDPKAVLVDVRTQPEWAFVGLCDLSGLNKSPLLVCWQEFPHMQINPGFAETLIQQGVPKDSAIYFLCRSGVRSQSAASAMVAAGYDKCYNILGGFEGDLDQEGHRGKLGGWKAAGLPWHQN